MRVEQLWGVLGTALLGRRLFVSKHPSGLRPAGIGDGPGEAAVGQHSLDVEVVDDEPVVGLDQLVGYLVQEMAAHIGDTVMMPTQPGSGICAVL